MHFLMLIEKRGGMARKWLEDFSDTPLEDKAKDRIEFIESIYMHDNFESFLGKQAYVGLASKLGRMMDLPPTIEKRYSEFLKRLSTNDSPERIERNAVFFVDGLFDDSLKHYSAYWTDIQIPAFRKHEFKGGTVEKLLSTFLKYETDYFKKRRLVDVSRYDTPPKQISSFGDGIEWFDLGKAACEMEGAAAGHCGNLPRKDTGDNIYSLRQIIEKRGRIFHKPLLTFVVDGNGNLREMKARMNRKPTRDMHDRILWLLYRPEIRSIDLSTSYLEGNDFDLFDLPEKDLITLFRAKPEFARDLEMTRTPNWYRKADYLNPENPGEEDIIRLVNELELESESVADIVDWIDYNPKTDKIRIYINSDTFMDNLKTTYPDEWYSIETLEYVAELLSDNERLKSEFEHALSNHLHYIGLALEEEGVDIDAHPEAIDMAIEKLVSALVEAFIAQNADTHKHYWFMRKPYAEVDKSEALDAIRYRRRLENIVHSAVSVFVDNSLYYINTPEQIVDDSLNDILYGVAREVAEKLESGDEQ